MKKLILFFIICLAQVSFASRARVLALGDSFHLADPYTAFGNPLDIAALNDFLVLDSGVTAPVDSETNAEAMMSYSLNSKTKMALALGHQEAMLMEGRQLINTEAGTSYVLEQNPIELFYTYNSNFIIQAVSARYSNFKNQNNQDQEVSSMLSYGVEFGSWQLYGKYVLLNRAETVGGKSFDGNGHFSLAARYGISSFTLGFDYYRNKIKSQTNMITDKYDHRRKA